MGKGRLSSPKCIVKIHVCGGDDEMFAAEDLLKKRLERNGWELSNKIESPGASINSKFGDQLSIFDLLE
ncbi:hypothetical protein GCM10022221_35420 [Actinocorallia aurea]